MFRSTVAFQQFQIYWVSLSIRKTTKFSKRCHCVKGVRIQSFSGPYSVRYA